jgi:hypothetical protein
MQLCVVTVCLVARRMTQPGTEALYMAGKTIAGDVRGPCMTSSCCSPVSNFAKLLKLCQGARKTNTDALAIDFLTFPACCLAGFPLGDAGVARWSTRRKSLQGSLTCFQRPHRYPGAAQGVPIACPCCSSCGTAQACYGGSSGRTLLTPPCAPRM